MSSNSHSVPQSLPPFGGKESLYQPALAVLLLFLAGSTFSLGVFIPQVEASSKTAHNLDGVWETAMGAMHFLSAPIMIFSSMYLDAGQVPVHPMENIAYHSTKTFRLRLLHMVSAIAFGLLAFSALGAQYSNRFMLFIGVSFQAFPLGILYLTCTQALLAWVPSHAGIAIAVGHFAFGLGTIGLTQVFSFLITMFGSVAAIYFASVILAVLAFLPALLLRWPPVDSSTQEEQDPLLQRFDPIESIPWRRLVRIPNFWLYIGAVFTTSSSYMLNPYYFKLGHLFNKPLGELVLFFNLSNLVATVCSLFSTALTDVVGFGNGFFFSGSKNIMGLLMVMQTICFFASIFINNSLNFLGFVTVKALLKIIVTCHVGCSALLARDLFGSKNSCIVFGFGAGLALGFGEATSAWIMAAVEAASAPILTPSNYNAFYWIATAWSMFGVMCIMCVQRHKSKGMFEPIYSRPPM